MRKILLVNFLIFINLISFGQYTNNCATADPFCTGTTYNFPLASDGTGSGSGPQAEAGPDYTCLFTTPNPVWYYLLIDQPGSIDIHMASSAVTDIDFTCWGPFSSFATMCGNLTSANTVDCSYSTADQEDCNISNALTGQYYLLLITNYANVPTNVTFNQTNSGAGAGSTNCDIVYCNITGITTTPGPCIPGPGTFTLTGCVYYNNTANDHPPTSGTMTVTVNPGGYTQTFNAPFAAGSSCYSIPNIPATGGGYTVTSIFSEAPTCTMTVPFTAPGPCNSCSANAGPDQTICGLSTNMAAVTQAGDYNLQWTGPAGITFAPANSPTTLITAASGGVYTLTWTITNSAGLTCSDDVIVDFTANPTSTFTVSNINCFGQNSTITYTGTSNPGSTYTWTFGGGTVASGSGSGPYQINWGTAGLQTITLQVSDNHCLSPVTTLQVNNPPDLLYTVTVDPAACPGSAGSVTPTASGGTPAYTYTWSNVTGPPFSSGNYTSTVTDALGCTESYAFTVVAPNNITLVPNQTNLTCNGNASGTASVVASGGTPPYTYAWPGGGTMSNVTGLAAGNYILTVTDNNGCTVTNSYTLTEPPVVNLQVTSVTNATCSGVCNGIATVNATGGTPGAYNYLWSNTNPSATATLLCAGTYTVTTADVNMCTASATVVITQPLSITASVASTTNATCFGLCNGSGTVNAVFGTPPYSFSWPGGVVSVTNNALCVGSYVVTASDANGCSTTTTVNITQPTQVVASTSNIISTNCYGSCDGSATVDPSGGTGPYSYNWASGTMNSQVNNALCAGSHFVTVTDTYGCTATSVALVPQPTQMTITGIVQTNVSCNGANDGTMTVSASGGTGAYTYSIGSQSGVTGIFNGLDGGIYTVTVTDAQGCTVTGGTTIPEPSPITVSTIPSYTICSGEWAYLTGVASGGTQPYTYFWDSVQTNASIGVQPATTTTYSVSVTDAFGCPSNSATVTVNVSVPLIVDLIATPASICPGDTVQLSVSMQHGGGPPYTVYFADGTVVIPPVFVSPESSGLQWLYVQDGCGSVGHDSAYITVNPAPVVNFASDTTAGCEPLTVAFTPMNPQAGQTYYWNFGDGSYNQLSYDMNPVHEFSQDGLFDVSLTVTSTNGCSTTFTNYEMISVYPLPVARFIADPSGASIIHPEIHFINVSELATSYIWSFGDGDSSSIENPWHWYTSINSYIARLIAVSDMGCVDTVFSTVEIRDEYTFYAPTAISPDFDDVNDVFYVIGNGISTKDFHMYIYDRWGEIIYETDKYDPDQPEKYGWNGSVKGGAMAPVGTYTWLVKFYDEVRIQHDKSGALNVIR